MESTSSKPNSLRIAKQTHDSIRAFLTEYVRDAMRMRYSKTELAAELAHLGMHGANVIVATASQWEREIERCIDDGILVDVDGAVRTPADDPRPVQMDLFS